MSNFIYNLIYFIYSILYNFKTQISEYITRFGTNVANSIELSITNYDNFLNKQILAGELINIGMTWRELILYALPILTIILLIIFMFKLIIKLFDIVRLG